jgi:putative nucleotidyltransferase with HDIG domain
MRINTRSLIEGLSYALDVAEKSYFSHSKHVAYISIMLAQELELSLEQQEDLYYASLLHDIGASNAYLIHEHCEVGRNIILKLPIKDIIADYVYYHHEYMNGTGPFELEGENIPLLAQIICISNLFDTRFRSIRKLDFEVVNEMKDWLNNNRELIHPLIVEAFYNLIDKEYILLDYFSNEFNNVSFKRIKMPIHNLDFEGVKQFAYAFSEIIDKRSRFTYEHSMGVAKLVNKITVGLNYNDEIQNKMYIAALLHDIGKLAISNDIIDKVGKLNEEERYEINKHTYYTRWILEQIDGFEDISNYASNHHEKLNASGYPLHLRAEQIGELDRVMAICDIYGALTEDRPYRSKMPKEKVWLIIDEHVQNHELDGKLVNKIKVILNVDKSER